LIYDKTHWFTDKEAWFLFRLFAFGETLGWTLLVSAIIYRKLDLPGYEIAIQFAGRVHGMLFLMYFVFVFVTARSMQWGFWRVLTALVAGIPPYTALLFEQVMAYDRKKSAAYVEPPVGAEE
jgi:integral membrane protein